MSSHLLPLLPLLLVPAVSSARQAADLSPSSETERSPVTLGAGTSGMHEAVGANYHRSSSLQSLDHWWNYNPTEVEREVAFLASAGLNTLRTFLSLEAYEANTRTFLTKLHHYAQTLAAERILFVPVLFDSFGIEGTGDPALDSLSLLWVKSPSNGTAQAPEFMERASAYVADVVRVIDQAIVESGEPDAWWIADVWNEPDLAAVPYARLAELVQLVRTQPAAPCTTVGFVDFGQNDPMLAALTDPSSLTILSGHPYAMFEEVLVHQLQEATEISNAYGGKPLYVSEIGLPGLFQYYGNVFEWLQRAQVGFTFWEAFVGSNQFKHLTGIFYSDPVVDGIANVRSPTAVNSLWSLKKQRDPLFEPPFLVRAKGIDEGAVLVGPADYYASTATYHNFLLSPLSGYGEPPFPLLQETAPGTLGMYSALFGWAYHGLAQLQPVDPTVNADYLARLPEFIQRYSEGDIPGAEAALFHLFDLTSTLALERGLQQMLNRAPELLNTKLTTRYRPGHTFDAHLETVAFDIDRDPLTVRFYVVDALTNQFMELPLERVTGTDAHRFEILGTPRTFGQQVTLAVHVSDGRGGEDLWLQTVALP